MIHVIHKKNTGKYPPNQVIYIGRGSALGNPYTHIKDRETRAICIVDTVEEAIAFHKVLLLAQIQGKDIAVCNMLNNIYKLAKAGDVYLACYCKHKGDEPCHGDTIKEIIEAQLH